MSRLEPRARAFVERQPRTPLGAPAAYALSLVALAAAAGAPDQLVFFTAAFAASRRSRSSEIRRYAT